MAEGFDISPATPSRAALDVSIQAQVINLLREVKERMDLTILFIAHNLSVVKYFSDRIGVMCFGKLVEIAPSDMLFEHTIHPYTRSLFSAIPQPDPISERKRRHIWWEPPPGGGAGAPGGRMREILPGHFVYATDEELEGYKKELAEGKV